MARFTKLLSLSVLTFASLTGASLAQTAPTNALKYGASCSGLDASCYNEWHDRANAEKPRALIYHFVMSGGTPHDNNMLGQTAAPALVALKTMLEDDGFEVVTSRNPTDMENIRALRSYNTIIFYNTQREALTPVGVSNLRLYMQSGGGFVAVHNAFGTQYSSPWFEGLLGGAQLFDHGARQTGTVVAHSANDISVAHITAGTAWDTEEWYNVYPDPRDNDVRILLSVEADSLKERRAGYNGHPGMSGDLLPISWCHYYDGGRAWLTTAGHAPEIYQNDESFRKHLLGGVRTTSGLDPFCQE